MKLLILVSLLAFSASASAFFEKSSNEKIAFCVVSDEKGGELFFTKFKNDKKEKSVAIYKLSGHLKLDATFSINQRYIDDKKLSYIEVEVTDTRSEQRAFAKGLSVPGIGVSTDSVSKNSEQGKTSAGASCEVIDEEFLEKNEFGNNVYLLLKHRLKNEK